MNLHNRRSGGIDQLSIAEGGTGQTSLENFRQAHQIVRSDDRRVVRVSGDNRIEGEFAGESVYIRPSVSISGSAIGTIENKFPIGNFDKFTIYEVTSEHGTGYVSDGHLYFTPSLDVDGDVTVYINGYPFVITVVNTQSYFEDIDAVGYVTSINKGIRVSGIDYRSPLEAELISIEVEASTSWDFSSNVFRGSKNGDLSTLTVQGSGIFYVRARPIDSNNRVGKWSTIKTIHTDNFVTGLIPPVITYSGNNDNNGATVAVRSEGFVNLSENELDSIEVTISTSSDFTQNSKNYRLVSQGECAVFDIEGQHPEVHVRSRFISAAGEYSQWAVKKIETTYLEITSPYNQIQTLTENSAPTDTYVYYSTSTAILPDGKTFLVSANYFDTDTVDNGRIFFYKRNGFTWRLFQEIIPDIRCRSFGERIKISETGRILLASYFNEEGSIEYAVYHLDKEGKYQRKQSIVNLYNGNKLTLGWWGEVSPDGKYIVFFNTDFSTNDPKLFLYRENQSSGLFELETGINCALFNTKIAYINSLSINEGCDRIALGLPTASSTDVSGNSDVSGKGEVIIFTKSNGVWNTGTFLTVPDSAKGVDSNFGYYLKMNKAGNKLLVGSFGATNTKSLEGAVYQYELQSNNWVLVNTIYSPEPQGSSYFGESFGVDSRFNSLMTGQPSRTSNDRAEFGIVPTHKRQGQSWSLTGVFRPDAGNAPQAGIVKYGQTVSMSASGTVSLVSSILAKDNNGNTKGNVLVSIPHSSNEYVSRPTLSLSVGDTGTSAILTINARGFSTSYENEVHESTEYQVSTNPDFSSLLIQHHTFEDKDKIVLFGLPRNEVLYVRARFLGNHLNISKWSDVKVVNALNKTHEPGNTLYKRLKDGTSRSYTGIGWSVSTNKDGSIVVAGTRNLERRPTNSDVDFPPGIIYIFKRDSSGKYSEIEYLSEGTSTGTAFGEKIFISADGSVLLTTAGDDSICKIYRLSTSTKKYVFETDLANPRAGSTYRNQRFALSRDGNTVIVSSAFTLGNNTVDAGYIFIYKYSSGSWTLFKTIPSVTNTVGYTSVRGMVFDMSNDGTVLGSFRIDAHPAGNNLPNTATYLEIYKLVNNEYVLAYSKTLPLEAWNEREMTLSMDATGNNVLFTSGIGELSLATFNGSTYSVTFTTTGSEVTGFPHYAIGLYKGSKITKDGNFIFVNSFHFNSTGFTLIYKKTNGVWSLYSTIGGDFTVSGVMEFPQYDIAHFGISMAIAEDNNLAFYGAPRYSEKDAEISGAVFVVDPKLTSV